MCKFSQIHMNIMKNMYLIHLHLFTNPYEYGDKFGAVELWKAAHLV